MKNHTFHTRFKPLLADTVTPVSIYLRLRDRFNQALLLESSDYHGQQNPLSFIACDPLVEVRLQNGALRVTWPGQEEEVTPVEKSGHLPGLLQGVLSRIEVTDSGHKHQYSGLFGYQSYDVVQYYESVEVPAPGADREIPELAYNFYRYLIVIDHFHNEMTLFDFSPEGEESKLDKLEATINQQALPKYPFALLGEETSPLDDEAYRDIVRQGIKHCLRGDVFQIVLSRPFSRAFSGDEFNVYRSLRAINPSPYLFFADFGSFKLMGSSPEAQLVIGKGEAVIYPIAGTFRRTGNDEDDSRLARELFDDPKENAEHVMLVDLARNDLSRHGERVKVDTFKEIQYYSHVIHLVSRVSARLREGASSLQLVADTFPAGTLSGAPKHMAMQLISRYEPQNRGFYGGCIGFLGLNGEFNSAIMIRSLLSKGGRLYYQAGAGVVAKSDPEKELQEVNNKLGALRKAMEGGTKLEGRN